MFLAGENVTAGRLNLLQASVYQAKATSATGGGATSNTDVPGCSVTFNTVNPNATFHVVYFGDFDLTGATTLVGLTRPKIDGVIVGTYACYQAGVATDRSTPGNFYLGTLPTAGSHTIGLVSTLPANMQLNIVTQLLVTVYEDA